VSACRSCHAPVIWAVTAAGKRMPVDAEPVDGGNVLLDQRQDPPLATVVGKQVQAGLFGDDGPRFASHYVTCPDADQWRKR
jgi:hypothetical protein